jgi:hypothetical protein
MQARLPELEMPVYDYARAREDFSQTQRQRPNIRTLQIAMPREFTTLWLEPSLRGATATKQSRAADWIASIARNDSRILTATSMRGLASAGR